MRFFLLTVLFLAGLGDLARAQLDLPPRRPEPEAPPVQPDVPRRESGDLAPRPQGERGGLVLRPAKPEPAPAPVPVEDFEYSADPDGALAFLLDQLAGAADLDSSVVRQAVQHLGDLGPVGLRGARRALRGDHGPTVMAAARTLLSFGDADDRRLLTERMASELPRGCAVLLVRELARVDPVLGGPELWASLLDHPQGPMRKAVHRELTPLAENEMILIQGALGSARADTRWLALDLLGQVQGPLTRRALVGFLGDPVAKVAAHAAGLLAARHDSETATLLRERALGGRIDRGAAYALLALCEVEDLHDEVQLGDDDVPNLLQGLRSSQELVSGASAIALAGIGFRSTRSRDMGWLDLEVPHTLVRLSSGAVFFKDFPSLRSEAQRRLALLSGRGFGGDGPAWLAWWAEVAEDFHARRAFIDVRPEEAGLLRIQELHRSAPERSIVLRGSRAAGSDPSGATAYLLPDVQCAQALAVLEREGVLGPGRLPVSLGPDDPTVVILEVSLGEQGKRFELRAGSEPPWYLHVRAMLQDLGRRNRWQLYPNPDLYHSQREYFETEQAWWARAEDPTQRARRLKQAIFAALPSRPSSLRDEGVADLQQLYTAGVPVEAADFRQLLGLLGSEDGFGERVDTLTDLALQAALGIGRLESGLDLELLRELLTSLHTGFGVEAGPALERVLAGAPAALVQETATVPEAALRRAAARALGERGDEQARASLLTLLADPDPRVERAAVRELGLLGEGRARTELLVRARVASPDVRSEALVAAARLGGEDILDLLVLGLSDSDPGVQRGAVEGLAELRDPRSASILASVFAEGAESPLFEPAQRGLLGLGEAAWPQLFRLTLSAERESRRSAALLLSQQGAAEAATTLLALYTDDPGDARVASELAILSGVDLRAEEDPAQAWWNWWDLVVHDDSLLWLCSAAEREGHRTPRPDELRGAGTPRAAAFLLDLVEGGKPHLAERARRELGRLLGRDLASPDPVRRREWLDELSVEVERAFDDTPR